MRTEEIREYRARYKELLAEISRLADQYSAGMVYQAALEELGRRAMDD